MQSLEQPKTEQRIFKILKKSFWAIGFLAMDSLAKLVESFRLAPNLERREAIGLQILEEIYPFVVRFVLPRAPHSVAEDVAQVIMTAIHFALPEFEARTDREFFNWCYVICRRRIADYFRKLSRTREVFSEQALEIVGKDLSDDGRFGYEEREVLEIFRGMDADAFEIAWDHFVVDIDWPEMAEERETTPDALRMQVKRAIEKLRRRIGEGQ